MVTKEYIIKTLVQNAGILRDYHIRRIGVFGSYVKGNPTEKSDIDLLVDFSETIDLFSYANLSNTISDIFKTEVDLVEIGGVKSAIKDKIMNEVEWIEGI